jgi:hypothetical protein
METVFSPLTVHQLIQTLAESERDYFATLLVNGFGFEMGVFPEPNAYEKFFHESPTPFRVEVNRSSSDSISLPTQNS